jgi:hypothetical protein
MDDHSLCQALFAYPAGQLYPDEPLFTLNSMLCANLSNASNSIEVNAFGWHHQMSHHSLIERPKSDYTEGLCTLQPLEVPETVSMRELLLYDEIPQMDVCDMYAGLDVGLDQFPMLLSQVDNGL